MTSVASTISSTLVSGTLFSTPNTTFVIQFFLNTPTSPPGPIEGQQFVGQVTAVTGANGIATYTANLPIALVSGQLITATATDSLDNTSEFSAPAPPRSSAPSSSR